MQAVHHQRQLPQLQSAANLASPHSGRLEVLWLVKSRQYVCNGILSYL
jgi:hypothetical protein